MSTLNSTDHCTTGIIIIINIVPLGKSRAKLMSHPPSAATNGTFHTDKRPLFQASFAAIFGISSVIGKYKCLCSTNHPLTDAQDLYLVVSSRQT